MKLLAVCILLSIIAIGDAGLWRWFRCGRSPDTPLQPLPPRQLADPEQLDDPQPPSVPLPAQVPRRPLPAPRTPALRTPAPRTPAPRTPAPRTPAPTPPEQAGSSQSKPVRSNSQRSTSKSRKFNTGAPGTKKEQRPGERRKRAQPDTSNIEEQLPSPPAVPGERPKLTIETNISAQQPAHPPSVTKNQNILKIQQCDAYVYAYRKNEQTSNDVRTFYAMATFISPTQAITLYNAQYTTENGWKRMELALPSGSGITSGNITTEHLTTSILLLTLPKSLTDDTNMEMVIYKGPKENYVLPGYGYIVGGKKDIEYHTITEQESNENSNSSQESSFCIVPKSKSTKTDLVIQQLQFGKALERNGFIYGLYLGVDETSNTRHKFRKIPGNLLAMFYRFIN